MGLHRRNKSIQGNGIGIGFQGIAKHNTHVCVDTPNMGGGREIYLAKRYIPMTNNLNGYCDNNKT